MSLLTPLRVTSAVARTMRFYRGLTGTEMQWLRVFASHSVDRSLLPWSNHTKDFKNDIRRYIARRSAMRGVKYQTKFIKTRLKKYNDSPMT